MATGEDEGELEVLETWELQVLETWQERKAALALQNAAAGLRLRHGLADDAATSSSTLADHRFLS